MDRFETNEIATMFPSLFFHLKLGNLIISFYVFFPPLSISQCYDIASTFKEPLGEALRLNGEKFRAYIVLFGAGFLLLYR